MNRIYKSNKKNFVLKNSDFREHLESLLSAHFNLTVNTFFYLVSKESQCALFLADEIAYYLEKRVSFRAIKNKIMKEIQQSEHPFFKGIRITCSGRVGGKSKKAQRSKTQTFKYGQTSLHVFSSKIDFAFKNANTSFGQVGVKIWVCYDVISPQPLKIKA
jgi:small subunit ribosomal protein S3